MPLFSVIIPFHDAEATLPETLASLAAQSEADWEALLIDDASRDGSLAIAMAAAARDPRLRVIHDAAQERARGVAASRNLGIAAARGAYVALLDADDRWLPGKLAAQRAVFAQGADIVFGSYRRVDHRGRVLGTVMAPARVALADALAGNPIGALTGAWRRARFPQARMPARDMHEDYAFWLMLLREGVVAQGLPDVLAEYRVHPGSASANKRRAARAVWEILGQQGLGGPRRLLCFLRYVLTAFARRL
ncbi:MAG: glycosyltransferase family 2 protein [Natronohydrobacter sp.]|nr:glycosyltransferase family 2 protein [Natronohydrobacter sp.]